MSDTQKWIVRALLILCAAGIVRGIVEMGSLLSYVLQGAIDSDALQYFIVGRGMLNGLLPYVDLFESKPPGIFLLTAMSLVMSGGERLATVLQSTIFVAIPACTGWFAFRISAHRDSLSRLLIAGAAVCIALLLSLYTLERAGTVETESFGAFFAILYVLSVFQTDENIPAWRMGISGILLTLSLGMKEPFLFGVIATSLLLAKNWKHFVKIFVIPLGIAAVLGLLGLLMMGLLSPFLRTYVPTVALGADRGMNDPLWLNGFSVRWLYGDLTEKFAPAPLLGPIMLLLWAAVPGLRAERENDNVWRPVAAWMLGLPVMLSVYAIALVSGHALGGGHISPENMRLLLTAIFGGAGCIAAIFWLLRAIPESAWLFLRAFLALYCVALGVSMGGYFGNHMVIAVPFYITLVLLFAQEAVFDSPKHTWTLLGVSLITSLTLLFVRDNPAYQIFLQNRLPFASEHTRETTRKLDDMMDTCNVDHYANFSSFELFAFAKHSPIGPLFVTGVQEYLPEGHSLILETIRRIDKKADIILIGKGAWQPSMKSEEYRATLNIMQASFTQTPPPCATPFLPLQENVDVWFRAEASVPGV